MRKLSLIYVALMLSLSPMASHAASKQKNVATGSKITHAKYTLNKNLAGKYKLVKYQPKMCIRDRRRAHQHVWLDH